MSLSLSCARATITKLVPDRKADDDGAKFTTVALKVEVKCSTDILAEFHPSLKDALFKREGGVRFPSMGELKWAGSRRGVDLAIRPAPDLKPSITLNEVNLGDFRLKPLSEGTQDVIALRFVATAENPTAPIGRILEYVKEAAWIDVKGGGELDLPPPSARTEIEGLGEDRDTKVTITGGGETVEMTAGELAWIAAKVTERQVNEVRKLQIRRMGAQEKLATYPYEVLRAAVKAEEEASNTRPMMVAMLTAEIERRTK